MARGDTARADAAGGPRDTARENLQRALERERSADPGIRREKAQKRAVAAELIVQEANAVRLQALLDAAREQETTRTIETAEQRFAVARGDWEATHRPPPRPENESPDSPAGAALAGTADPDRDDVADVPGVADLKDEWSLRRAAAAAPRRIGLSARHTMAGIAVVLSVAAAGLLFYAVSDDTSSDDAVPDNVTVARTAPANPGAPAITVSPSPPVSAMQREAPAPVTAGAEQGVSGAALPEVSAPPAAAEPPDDVVPMPEPVASVAAAPPAAEPPDDVVSMPEPVASVAAAPPAVDAPPVPKPAVRRAKPSPAPTPGRNPFRAVSAPAIHAETVLHFTAE